MVSYHAASSLLPGPHELRSCGASDGQLPLQPEGVCPWSSSSTLVLSHIHAALRAEPDTAPLEIAFCYQNNLAHLLRGEYSMQAVRNRLPAT